MSANVIEVGQHAEMALLDYMVSGSTVAKLLFDLTIIRILHKRGACEHTMTRAWADANAHAVEAQTKVFRYATAYSADEYQACGCVYCNSL